MAAHGGHIRYFRAKAPSARRRGRPWGGRCRGRRRGGRCRRCLRGGRRTCRRGDGLRFSLHWGGLSGSHRRRRGRKFDKDRVRHETRSGGLTFGAAVTLVRSHRAHRNRLRLVARQREAHREFAGAHRERAGSSAGLAKRRSRLGAGRLGLELHARAGGRRFQEARRVELHPTGQAGACRKTQSARDNRDNSFHDRHRPLKRPNGPRYTTLRELRAGNANPAVPLRHVPAATAGAPPEITFCAQYELSTVNEGLKWLFAGYFVGFRALPTTYRAAASSSTAAARSSKWLISRSAPSSVIGVSL